MSCRKKDCDKRAEYNEKGEVKPKYCVDHKKKGNILIVKKKKTKVLKSDSESNFESDSDISIKNVGLILKESEDTFKLDESEPKVKSSKKSAFSKTIEGVDPEDNFAGKKWNKDQIDQLLAYVSKGKSNAEIGKLLGRTYRAVFCKKQCLAFELSGEKSTSEIAKTIGLTKEEVEDTIKLFTHRESKKVEKKEIKTSCTSSQLAESIVLVDKIKELIDKNMEHYKLTGKSAISEKIFDELMKGLKQ